MKLIKMKIRRQSIDGHTQYTYPTPFYDATKVSFGPIYEGGLPSVVQSDVLPRNADDEYIVVGVADIDAPEFLKAHNLTRDGFTYTAEEIDKIKTLELGNKWTGPTVNKITDQNKVIDILAKTARGEVLTVEEQKAIDPNDPTLGINRSKTFQESLDEALK